MEAKFLAETPDSIGDLLTETARKYGDNTAIELIDRNQTLTFSEWDTKATQLAHGFARHGVTAGMHVGVMLRNRLEFPISWLALAKLGAVMVPINPSYTAPELDFVIQTAQISWLLIEAESIEQVERAANVQSSRVVLVDAISDRYVAWQSLLTTVTGKVRPQTPIKQSDRATIQFTSGTTGFPKGVTQSHLFWLLCGYNMGVPRQVFTDGAILGESPFFYFDGLWFLMRTLTHGAKLHQAERMSISKALDRLTSTQVEVAYAPVLGQEPDPREKAHNVKYFISIGSSAERIKELERRLGAPVREGYGMTEIGVALSVPYQCDDPAAIGTCGRPTLFYDIKVADETGAELAPNTPGELWVRGKGIMDGYWNNPQATQKALVDGWFRTGDLFEMTPEGYFRFVGRLKDMIKRSGENVSAVEVESVVATYPGVQAVAVVPVPDPIRGEEVKAVIQVSDDCDGTDFDYGGLHAHCAASLARFKIPRYVELTEGFRYTPSNKIIKTELIGNQGGIAVWDYTVNAMVSF